MSFSWGIWKEVLSLLFQGWFRCTLFKWKGNFVPFQSSFWLSKPLPAWTASHQSLWDAWVWSLGWEAPLEKGRPTHSSILAWRIPWSVQSLGSQSQTGLSDSYFQFLWSLVFFFFCSKVFNTRKVWLLTLFYHILEFSVHLLFSSGLSLHLRLWNAICFSRGSLKGLLANPTPNNKNNKNKIPPPTIFPKPWSICLGNFYVIYYKILWLVICAQTWSFLYILSSLKAKII